MNFSTRFGILVPNTNYPPGVDYRIGGMGHPRGENVRILTFFIDLVL